MVKIYLVGLSGVGKSTIGKELSSRLSLDYIDMDFEIEKQEGISISDSLSIVTSNVSDNLGLQHKGRVRVGADADFCVFNDSWELQNVIAMGEMISLE